MDVVHPVRLIRIEADFVTKQWNLIADGETAVDFEAFSVPDCDTAACISAPACAKTVWGIGYHPGTDPYEPILMELLLDTDDETVWTRVFERIFLPAGRTVTKVSDMMLPD